MATQQTVRHVTWLFINFDGGFVAHNAREGNAYPGPAPPTKVVNFTSSGDTGTATTTISTTGPTTANGNVTTTSKASDPLHDLPCYNEYLRGSAAILSSVARQASVHAFDIVN
ncbi:hypothetical protein PoB_005230600 [Plakobranchus ocellatus]|uniref:Uncharacterized protein n=1 Tax=Plakobranchus ocellatus TaxID=259542 RepID=A0AAV4C331_9GAST|nr:hypothetical protein PoB_005230600 [Plakobranchus ocellatus]